MATGGPTYLAYKDPLSTKIGIGKPSILPQGNGISTTFPSTGELIAGFLVAINSGIPAIGGSKGTKSNT